MRRNPRTKKDTLTLVPRYVIAYIFRLNDLSLIDFNPFSVGMSLRDCSARFVLRAKVWDVFAEEFYG
jgi:hypothetical protein